ncbi:cell division protein FtsA, partial [Pseudomonas aeruginosa]
DYVSDNQDGVREPLGLSGVRLAAQVHVVTCAVNASQNIEKCVRRCGLELDDILLAQLASAYSGLTGDAKELGVRLVDVGGRPT